MEKISEWFKEEDDYFVRKNVNKANIKKDTTFVTNLIEGTDTSNEEIATLVGVSVEFVEQIRKELKEKKN